MREGLASFDAVLSDRPEPSVTPAVSVKAVTDHSVLANGVAAPGDPARAQEALALARQLDDRALIVAALTACGALTIYDATTAGPLSPRRPNSPAPLAIDGGCAESATLWQCLRWPEALGMTRAAHGPQLKKDAILPMPLVTCPCRGDPECGSASAIAIQGDLNTAGRELSALAEEVAGTRNLAMTAICHGALGQVRAYQGDSAAALAHGETALQAATAMGGQRTLHLVCSAQPRLLTEMLSRPRGRSR